MAICLGLAIQSSMQNVPISESRLVKKNHLPKHPAADGFIAEATHMPPFPHFSFQ